MGEEVFGTLARAQGYAYGHFGKDVIDDTTEHEGNWYAIQMLEDTVFETLTDGALESGTHTGKTFPAGFMYYGKFTVIKLTSGSCIAYRALVGEEKL